MNKTKLTPLGRLTALVAIMLFGAIVGAAGATATRPHAQAWRCISVRPGDTLWTMAGPLGDGDRRETVQAIVDHNGLDGGALGAGMTVWVPNEGDLSGFLEVDPSLCPAVR